MSIMTFIRAFILLMMLGMIRPGESFRAYDCFHPRSNITTVSLSSVQACPEIADDDVHVQPIMIQVVQEKDWVLTHVTQCRVDVVQTIHYCGMHSHISLVNSGLKSYLIDLPRESCVEVTRHGELRLEGVLLTDIVPNGTTSLSATRAGRLTASGECEGASFSTPSQQYSRVVVQASYTFLLRDYDVLTDVASGAITFTDGITCSYAAGKCVHPTLGASFWSPADHEDCSPRSRSIIYEGSASLTSSSDTVGIGSVVSVNQGSSLFSIKITGESNVCHQTAYSTDHSRVFLIRQNTFGFFFQKSATLPQNRDLSMYMNSKISYVTAHLEDAVRRVYVELTARDCELERLSLLNKITLARYFPYAYGNLITGEPGYYSVVAGEVMHMVQCQPVEVILRRSVSCHSHLPVTYNNASVFVDPYNGILSNTSAEIPCSSITPPMYRIHGRWFSLNPSAAPADAPVELSPRMNVEDYPFAPLDRLMSSGLYDAQAMEDYRRFMSFPLVKADATDFVASRVSHTEIYGDAPYDAANLLSAGGFDKIVSRVSQKIFGFLYHFGAWAGAFWGIIMLWKLGGKIVGIAVNTCHLYSVFGFSYKLIASLFTPITHWIISRDTLAKMAAPDRDDCERELQALTEKYPRVCQSADRLPSAPDTSPLPDQDPRILV